VAVLITVGSSRRA